MRDARFEILGSRTWHLESSIYLKEKGHLAVALLFAA
jgi:hypothetical protein